MYQVYYNDLPLYDPRGQEFGLLIREPECRLAVGEAGSLEFTIDHDHPYAGELSKLKGIVELRAEGRAIYKGRILKDTQDFNLSRTIETEGLFACLNDSIIPPYNFPEDFLDDAAYIAAADSGNVIRFFLEWILAEHNSQVGPSQQIELGDVTVTDPNNYLYRSSSEYLTTMETLKRKITDTLDGYLLVDYGGPVTKVHFYADLPLTNTQVVEFGENLLDLVNILDVSETCTAIFPIGAEGLTIESLPDGELTPGYFKEGRIIYSKAMEDLYDGIRITRMEKWDDVTEGDNLQRKALAKLSTEGVTLSRTIEVSAIDLTDADGSDVARFMVGRYVELRSTPHGFSASYPLMELEPDILDPGNTQITMGVTVKAASDIANGNQSEIKENLNQQQIELNNQQAGLTELAEATLSQITAAIQTAEALIFSAIEEYNRTLNLEGYKSTVASEFKIMADQINLKFTEATEQIQDVNGDLQKTVETLEKHFDFSLDGLVIKAGENAMTLTLDNDMIIFKKNGQQFGWWDGVDFHTGNIVINVNERAQFGNFAFVPRSNKSLSFLKVGG